MQLDPLKAKPSVDSKTAQEALALAIRLQQEKGEQVSIEELQRTADEAGIDRVYLDKALHQVSNKVEPVHEPGLPNKKLIAIVLAAVLAMSMALVVSAMRGDQHSPVYILALCFAFIIARRALRTLGRGAPRRRFRDGR